MGPSWFHGLDERCAEHTLPLTLAFAFSATSAVWGGSSGAVTKGLAPGPAGTDSESIALIL